MIRRSTGVIALAAFALAAGVAQAQGWPERPVRFIIPGTPGSAPEIIGRVVADKLAPLWNNRPVVIDPKAGGNTVIGVEAAVRAAPDGFNFLFTQAAALTISPYTIRNLPYDVERDLVPIVHVGFTPMLIAVHPDVPAKTLAELVELVRARPGKIDYGTSSTRNVPHLTGELFNSVAGIRMNHIPYKGSAQATADAIGGQVQVAIDGTSALITHIRAGRLRVLAITSLKRFPPFPDIPTVSELFPGFEMTGWFAVMAPTGTSREVIDRVNRDVNTVLRDADLAARFLQFGAVPSGGTPDELAKTLRDERARFAKVVKDARIEPQ